MRSAMKSAVLAAATMLLMATSSRVQIAAQTNEAPDNLPPSDLTSGNPPSGNALSNPLTNNPLSNNALSSNAIIIGGEAQPPRTQRCIEVQIGADKTYHCLNQQLKQQSERVNPASPNVPPLDATSPDVKLGIVNIPAVKEQYGRNFGVSAFPYRPPPLVYTSPLGAHR
jgi:hypothetical protein